MFFSGTGTNLQAVHSAQKKLKTPVLARSNEKQEFPPKKKLKQWLLIGNDQDIKRKKYGKNIDFIFNGEQT